MTDKQKKFLILRADDLSFDKIAKELKVSKPTLIQWSKLFSAEINDMRFQSLSDLKEEFKYSKRAKYKQLLIHLGKVDTVIDTKDIEETSFKDLMMIRNNLVAQLDNIERQTSFINTGLVKESMFGEKEILEIKLDEL